jgi:hypothetical protein
VGVGDVVAGEVEKQRKGFAVLRLCDDDEEKGERVEPESAQQEGESESEEAVASLLSDVADDNDGTATATRTSTAQSSIQRLRENRKEAGTGTKSE